ncbi:hypothetical protein [Okeania sp. SIO3B5]|nr:hypothetical protein [Okeania sp. SIO3B5]
MYNGRPLANIKVGLIFALWQKAEGRRKNLALSELSALDLS